MISEFGRNLGHFGVLKGTGSRACLSPLRFVEANERITSDRPKELGYIAMGRGYTGLKRERHGCSVNGNDQILKTWRWKNDDKTRASVDRP